MLAQLDPEATFQMWWIPIAALVPMVYPFFVRRQWTGEFKFAISLLMSLAVAVAVMSTTIDTSSLTVPIVIGHCFAFIGLVGFVYKVADIATGRLVVTPDGESKARFNDLPMFNRGQN